MNDAVEWLMSTGSGNTLRSQRVVDVKINGVPAEDVLAKEVMQHDREYIDELMVDAARIDWMDKACSKGGPGMRLEYEPGGLRAAIDKEMGK